MTGTTPVILFQVTKSSRCNHFEGGHPWCSNEFGIWRSGISRFNLQLSDFQKGQRLDYMSGSQGRCHRNPDKVMATCPIVYVVRPILCFLRCGILNWLYIVKHSMDQGPYLLTKIKFNHNMDNYLASSYSVELNYLSIPKHQSGAIDEWKWMSNFIPHFTELVITYPCWS